VAAPGFHLAGHTSFGWLATNCAACTLRTSSSALRPMPLSWISAILTKSSGLTTNVPRYASPSSSMYTPKARASRPVGSASMGYLIFLMVSEASCHALCVKCVSVLTE
jgi:hypothetical protein